MTRRRGGAVLALLLLTAACGGSPEEEEDTGGEAAAGGGGPTLQATVGTEESPDAFEITLVDEDGEAVTELPAGEYTIEVNDLTTIHNFHLSGGDGAVEEKTTPGEVVEVTWQVTFEPGDYRYICDPHPSMNGQFTVT
jgi:plastocyanin